jgi:predicted DCC family thiol-disulfide oxidoreductase YuxK
VTSEKPKTTAYYDGACPLCRAEIAYYRRKDTAAAVCFVDVAASDAATPEGVSQIQAMQRVHVVTQDGRVRSGAAAFVAIWEQLPGWRWAARLAALPGVLATLEFGYRLFLPIRPYLSRLVGRKRP